MDVPKFLDNHISRASRYILIITYSTFYADASYSLLYQICWNVTSGDGGDTSILAFQGAQVHILLEVISFIKVVPHPENAWWPFDFQKKARASCSVPVTFVL